MDLKLNVSKKGLSTQEEVINEEYTLRYGHIFRGEKGDTGEKGEKGDNGVSPKISDNGTWLVFSDELETYVDTGIKASGSDNNYTDDDKALVQTIPNKVGQDEFDETVTSLGEAINDVGSVLADKADKEGYYPSMSVGMADNLVGRGDVQDAQINFRPSAGADNITDGAARIERIKGNSVVWNQLISNSRFETAKDYNVIGGATLNVDGGIATITLGTSNYSGVTNVERHSKLLVGHKYLFITEAKADTEMQNVLIPYVLSAIVSPKNTVSTEWRSYSFVKEATSATMAYGVARAGTYGTDFQGGAKIYAKSFRVIDLTKEFGAEVANNITSYEDYLQLKPMNIEDEFAYNEGTLVDMKVDSLVSVSDNAYDYTKGYARVMGGYKYDITANAGATLEVSFYADGEDDNEEREITPDSEGKYTFPANGICHVNADFGGVSDVCVCLNHSYDKPHPAYQQEVKDLSFISEVFPEGMRSAGSAFDEIRFNPTKKVWEKIVRVGVRAYAEGDAEDSSVTTDGKTTNYPLDNPTPTTIDLSPNFNLDYLVWDFGTEEAIVPDNAQSAPFRADIKYADNFVDDIRKNKEDIATNKANIAKNASAINSKQNTLTLTTKPNGNIVIGNLAGQSKEFMPATPSGDPMHYAYETVGAVYNATNADITSIGFYGETITHKAGFWKLNEIGNIDNEEMRLIYMLRYPSAGGNALQGWFSGYTYRTNMMNVSWQSAHDLVSIISNAYNVEVFNIGNAIPKNLSYSFYETRKLYKILGTINANNLTYFPQTAFQNCIALQYITLKNLKVNAFFQSSPLLSKESLLYLIDNCASNATFTITLHPDVYAKCTDADNGEWYDDVVNAIDTARESKNTTITLASA